MPTKSIRKVKNPKNQMLRKILLLLAMSFLVTLCLADELEVELTKENVSADLYKIEAEIVDKRFLREHIDEYLEKLPAYTAWSNKCVTDTTEKLKENEDQQAKLGEASADESADSAFTRQSLDTEEQDLNNSLSTCKAIQVRSDAAIKNIGQFRKENLQKISFARGDNILVVLNKILSVSDYSETRLAKLLSSKREVKVLNTSQIIMLLSILVITIVIGLFLRSALSRWDSNQMSRWQNQHLGDTDTGRRFIASLMMTIRRYVLPLLVSISLATFMAVETFDQVPTPLITILTYDLPLLILTFALIYFLFTALPTLGLHKDIDNKILNSLSTRLGILAITVYLGHLLFQTILANSLAEETFFLARAILCFLLVLNIIWALWLTNSISISSITTKANIVTSLVLIGAFIAELNGYRNLSGYIIQGVIGTLIAILLLQTFTLLIKRFLNEINMGKTGWSRQIKLATGGKVDKSIPGFVWIKLFLLGIIWLAFILSLLLIWDVPQTETIFLLTTITQGFSIGSFKIIPIKIFEATVILIVLLVLNGWFQSKLEKKFLTSVGIGRGARESIATISNYIGITLVIIISLAIVGMDFSKLAIIAGALSVGIGFGLQNVVNNFVSGLILLFERPIKTGDWIEAGGVQGTVKKISIRSTQIETFDRAEVIIPNSELISGNLTNWELKDQFGRIKLPIGVAYGSDTGKVRELLLKVAAEHESVVTNDADIPDPVVMFLSFGDSSLDFELRCFIGDIKKRSRVLSDLHFSIDAIFRENDIEIPFPQRVVHLEQNKSSHADTVQGDVNNRSEAKD